MIRILTATAVSIFMFTSASYADRLDDIKPDKLSEKIEKIIDQQHKSDESIYDKISMTLTLCTNVYKNEDLKNTPRFIQRNRKKVIDYLDKTAKILHNNDKTYNEEIVIKINEMTANLSDNEIAQERLLQLCNMYLVKDDLKAAVDDTIMQFQM